MQIYSLQVQELEYGVSGKVYKIFHNGVVREMTKEEFEFFSNLKEEFPTPEPTPEERIRDLEEALALLLSGVTTDE